MIAVEVKLWGTTIGALSMQEGDRYASFEYTPQFIKSGIEPAPLTMPLTEGIYRFPLLPISTFHGLPGLFADSLPDKFGNQIIDAWLTREGRTPGDFTALERLCYTGKRGMGALEFYPVQGPNTHASETLDIEHLRKLAESVLNTRKTAKIKFKEAKDFQQILRVGTSAGGARAKVLIALNEKTGEIRSGQTQAPDGCTYWLLKLDDVENNGDKEGSDTQSYGAIEYAYSQMAKAAGIEMSECRLLEASGHRHFMTQRFDRNENGQKLHYQSLAGLAHFDFNAAGAYSYEQAIGIIKQMNLGIEAVEAFFRRALFNICVRNQDDHAKNSGFLMDKNGTWKLAPAFDITYSYNPGGLWTGTHQMTFNGKRDQFTQDDIKAVATYAGLKRGRYKAILEEVQESVNLWKTFAKNAGVSKSQIASLEKVLRKF